MKENGVFLLLFAIFALSLQSETKVNALNSINYGKNERRHCGGY